MKLNPLIVIGFNAIFELKMGIENTWFFFFSPYGNKKPELNIAAISQM